MFKYSKPITSVLERDISLSGFYKNNPFKINTYKIKEAGTSYILYDPKLIPNPDVRLFDVDYHTNNEIQQNNSAMQTGKVTGAETEGKTNDGGGIGRARVIYFLHDNITLVLKHYYRGGAVAALLKDRYIGFTIENTRAFKEWRLLKKMRDFKLPVPDAAAAHVKKSLFFYRADLITRKIENTRTLSDCLTNDKLNSTQWGKVGACIKSFHRYDIYHADLNARNILLDEKGEVYLIDFDNSYIRTSYASWKQSNLARLNRSLLKFKKNEAVFHFDEQDWSALIDGYR